MREIFDSVSYCPVIPDTLPDATSNQALKVLANELWHVSGDPQRTKSQIYQCIEESDPNADWFTSHNMKLGRVLTEGDRQAQELFGKFTQLTEEYNSFCLSRSSEGDRDANHTVRDNHDGSTRPQEDSHSQQTVITEWDLLRYVNAHHLAVQELVSGFENVKKASIEEKSSHIWKNQISPNADSTKQQKIVSSDRAGALTCLEQSCQTLSNVTKQFILFQQEEHPQLNGRVRDTISDIGITIDNAQDMDNKAAILHVIKNNAKISNLRDIMWSVHELRDGTTLLDNSDR